MALAYDNFNGNISEVIPKNYDLRLIAEGAYGDVYLIRDDENPELQKFVVKKVKTADAKKDRNQKISELEILKKLNHPRIVPFYGYKKTQFELQLFMGYMKMGSLSKYIADNGHFDEARTKLFTAQILEGISYLHNYKPNPIIHRDIKGENILMEDEYNVRITDFGVSKVLTDLTNARTNTGTFNYKAPETFIPGKIYDIKADIWSLGCTVFEMVTGIPPYETIRNTHDLIKELDQGKPPDHSLLGNCSPNLQQFLEKCFRKQPEDRPSADELLLDDFLRQ